MSVIDTIISNEFESLEKEHMQLFNICCGNKAELESANVMESWLKVFTKLKNYLLVSICDPEICADSLNILHNFLTTDSLKYHIYSEIKEVFVKSLELLYSLGALTKQGALTEDVGAILAELPLEPRLGLLLINSAKEEFQCTEQIL